MARVLILGGGFGGVASAHALRSAAKDSNEVLLVDQRSHFAVGFRKSWGLFDPERYSEGLRPLASLSGNGIEFRQGTIESVSPNDRTAVVDGKQIEADSVILALGAEHAPTAVPGFGDHVHNLYESDAIGSINESFSACGGGRVGIGIFGTPYTCPPAPYEIAYLLREFLEARDIAVEIEVFTPKPMSLPVLGQAGCSVIEDRLTERGIRFLPNHQATRVEAGRVHFTTGPRSYDLILGVPPHRPPQLLAGTGLFVDGWVRPDPETLETNFPDVFAIGDMTFVPMANGKPLPKAGVFAEKQGQFVARRILARLEGHEPETTFDGFGGCFLEIGGGEAVKVEGDFLAQPAPQVTISGPSSEMLAAKLGFEQERLETWFGG